MWSGLSKFPKRKRNVEGTAGTRDADKAIAEAPRYPTGAHHPFLKNRTKKQTRLQSDASLEASRYNREESL